MKTIYNTPFQIKDKECLLFIETVGVNEKTDYVTLISISFNHEGKGQILQLFNETGTNEKELLTKAATGLTRFCTVYTTWPWFAEYFTARASLYGISPINNVQCLNVAFPTFYRNREISRIARKSIGVYQSFLASKDNDVKGSYLAYNRKHTEKFFDWIATNSKFMNGATQ